MIPTEAALADMAAIRCDQDEGDPFGWWDGSTLTPEGAWRGSTGVLPASGPSGGLPEPDVAERQAGAHRRRAGNGGT